MNLSQAECQYGRLIRAFAKLDGCYILDFLMKWNQFIVIKNKFFAAYF